MTPNMLLMNLGSLGLFTILAIKTGKWWIILFAIFFQCWSEKK